MVHHTHAPARRVHASPLVQTKASTWKCSAQNTEMESHEEKLHKMIIQSKINDTKDIMKRKAMEIDKSKIERREGRGGAGGFAPAPSMGGMPSSGALGQLPD